MIRDFIGDQVKSGVLFDGTYGLEIETESLGRYRNPKFTFWDVKGDGSLRHFGQEFILKVPLKYGKELDDALEEFKEKTAKIDFIQDSNSTSVHIHVNMLPESWKTMGNFLTLYTLVENVLLEISGEFRRNNLFCLPIRSVPFVKDVMVSIFRQINEKSYRLGHLIGENQQDAIKYAALNIGCLLRFGSVEIRSFRGENNTEVIHSWVSIINKLLEYARTETNPNQIMDKYKNNSNDLLEEVFTDYWDLVKYPNMNQLLEPNLWYAGDFAYSLNEEQWQNLDVLPVKKKIKRTDDRDFEILNNIARKIYGNLYNDLNRAARNMIDMEYDNRIQREVELNQLVAELRDPAGEANREAE